MASSAGQVHNKVIIKYELTEGNEVKINIYNKLGDKVRELVNEYKDSGIYTIEWDGKNDEYEYVASGLYLVHIESANLKDTKKIVLIK